MGRPSKVHKHGNYFRCRIDGVEHHLGSDRRKAFAKFHDLMAERYADVPKDLPQTVNGAVGAWLKLNEVPSLRGRLRRFTEFCGDTCLDDVTPDLLTRYHLWLKSRPVQRYRRSKGIIEDTGKSLGNSTIKEYTGTALRVLTWTHKQGWLERVPEPPSVPKSVRKARDIPLERLDEILASLPERAGRILRFIAYTGCRPSEACGLEWRDVHTDQRLCILTDHKTVGSTGEPRTIYLTDEALDVLHELRPTIGHVFLNERGKPYTSKALYQVMRNHSDNETPYQLRHTFAQTASESIPEQVLARLLGHSTTRITATYYRVKDKRALEAARQISLKPFRPVTATG